MHLVGRKLSPSVLFVGAGLRTDSSPVQSSWVFQVNPPPSEEAHPKTTPSPRCFHLGQDFTCVWGGGGDGGWGMGSLAEALRPRLAAKGEGLWQRDPQESPDERVSLGPAPPPPRPLCSFLLLPQR